MELRFTPTFFYGSAAAALMGLSMGIALHGPWQEKAGGPRMLFSSAAGADLGAPGDDGDIIQASTDQAENPNAAYLYDGYLPADPLPVARLRPDRYPDLWSSGRSGVTQASADEGQRVNPDDLYKADVSGADVFADDQPRADPTDDELPAADQTPRAPVRYSALQAAEPNLSF